MTAHEIETFTNILTSKRAEVSFSMRVRDEIVIEKVADAIDEVQLMGERELAIRTLDRDSKILHQVHRALQRIADETYGVCLNCEEDISPRRLNAVPWAGFCIKCQERLDRHEIEIDENIALQSVAA